MERMRLFLGENLVREADPIMTAAVPGRES
jgi:hypothetical protein